MSDCIFCQIVAGDAPAYHVYEDERCVVFLDLFPASRGHTLIIPKRHCQDIFDADPEDVAAVARLSHRIAAVLDRVVGADGLGVHQLNRAAAGQTVFHYHTHLIPAWNGQTLQLHGRAQGNANELEALSAEIKRELAQI